MAVIYKYLSPLRLDALENATLRATQANALNDPFELKPFFSALIDKADLQKSASEIKFEQELKNVYSQLPAAQRAAMPWEQVLALSRQHGFEQQFRKDFETQIDGIAANQLPLLTEAMRTKLHDEFGNKVGIVSFSETPSETLMWSHYANDHKGYVIEFDPAHPFFDSRRSQDDEFFHLRPVDYYEKTPVYAKFTDLDGPKLLCAKQAKWSYERERRILIPVDPLSFKGNGEPIHLIAYPRDAVRAVILGEKSSVEFSNAIRAVISAQPAYSGVQIRKAKADLATGEIVITDLAA